MERDYIILMGPWGSTGPIEVTAVRTGETLAGNVGRVLERAASLNPLFSGRPGRYTEGEQS
jgi:hypothetical protein